MLNAMKGLIYGSVLIFSTIGGYIPSLWHAGFFSISGIIGGIVGTAMGIWIAVKINNYVNI
jgi:ABC-type lipoprotein release transport system permease subunit